MPKFKLLGDVLIDNDLFRVCPWPRGAELPAGFIVVVVVILGPAKNPPGLGATLNALGAPALAVAALSIETL